MMSFVVPQNLAGLPSCTVRAGFDLDGLPVESAHGVALERRTCPRRRGLAVPRNPRVQTRWPAGAPLTMREHKSTEASHDV